MSDTPDPERFERLQQAMLNLPRLQQEIFLACCQDELSYEEIARRTGLSVKEVERHLGSALHKLARQIDGHSLRWWQRLF